MERLTARVDEWGADAVGTPGAGDEDTQRVTYRSRSFQGRGGAQRINRHGPWQHRLPAQRGEKA